MEDVIPSVTNQIQGEGFVVNGNLEFVLFGDQKLSHYNSKVPVSTSFPTTLKEESIDYLQDIVKKAVSSAQFENGGLNIEFIQDINGDFHLLELGPRNGGNFMPQLVKRCVGIDLARWCIEVAMGNIPEISGYSEVKPHTQLILHSVESGGFRSIDYIDQLQAHIVEEHIYAQVGDSVRPYQGSHDVIGVCILDLPHLGEVGSRTLDIEKLVTVVLDEE